ncbi:MAG: adenosylmethionine decarboxylase [SAR202 cluster bacterium]|nr:adenosylmethionine decarboxylase [SAR202 cluster bacterium]
MNALGTHLLLELQDCKPELLDNISHIEKIVVEAALKAGATIVGKSFHKFSPLGVTGIVAIAESHVSIHTWPEHGYAAADIFTCGDTFDPMGAAQLMIQGLECKSPTITEVKRGFIPQRITPSLAAVRG